MRIHHLNCGSLCPRGGSLFGGSGGPWAKAPMCCHVLLIESHDRLILVDAGLGVEDVAEPSRLGFLFNALVRPRLEVAETALRQVADLGFRVSDVRHIVPTHLDLDHAGGLADFPAATVHVFEPELKAALNPTFREKMRYRKAQLSVVEKWQPIEGEGGDTWYGFSSVRALPSVRDRILLIPLPGHTRGHCGVAVETQDGWLLHCGDAYFHRSEVAPGGGKTPAGIRGFEALVEIDRKARLENQARLKELATNFGRDVKLICSHDPVELAALKTAAASDPTVVLEPGPAKRPEEPKPGLILDPSPDDIVPPRGSGAGKR